MDSFYVQPLFGSLMDEGEAIEAKDKKHAARLFCELRKLPFSRIVYCSKRWEHAEGKNVSIIRFKMIDGKKYINGRYGFYKILPLNN